MSRRGFTLIEITVALIIGGMALSAAAALLTGLAERSDEIRAAGLRVDRDANAERLLRGLFGNVRLSDDTTHTVGGDSTAVTFLSWCETVEGWLRACRAGVTVEPDAARLQLTIALASGETRVVAALRAARGPVRIRYLRDAADGGRWTSRWNDIVPPRAVELIAGIDTLLLHAW